MRFLISVRKLDVNNGPESNPVKYSRAFGVFILQPQQERNSISCCAESSEVTHIQTRMHMEA